MGMQSVINEGDKRVLKSKKCTIIKDISTDYSDNSEASLARGQDVMLDH